MVRLFGAAGSVLRLVRGRKKSGIVRTVWILGHSKTPLFEYQFVTGFDGWTRSYLRRRHSLEQKQEKEI
jgi:hypothetical protein